MLRKCQNCEPKVLDNPPMEASTDSMVLRLKAVELLGLSLRLTFMRLGKDASVGLGEQFATEDAGVRHTEEAARADQSTQMNVPDLMVDKQGLCHENAHALQNSPANHGFAIAGM